MGQDKTVGFFKIKLFDPNAQQGMFVVILVKLGKIIFFWSHFKVSHIVYM